MEHEKIPTSRQSQNDLKAEALEFARILSDKYLVQRDFNSLLHVMDENISCIGTGEDEISYNLEDLEISLSRELSEYSDGFHIAEQWFNAVPCSDTYCLVYGGVKAVPQDSTFSENKQRFTLLLNKTPQGMKLVHMHLSRPDEGQELGHYYVQKSARADSTELRQTLDIRNRQLEVLNRNIPGGAHQCKNDSNLTLITMSDSFLAMFGYSREEISTLFHNNFIEMVHPDDRTTLLSTTHEQLRKGRDIELEYRVLCKNGTPMWILDKGRLLEDGDGGENFYCLLIELTERKKEQEDLRLSLERHQVIMDQATDIIFEWDIQKDTLLFSKNWYKKFGYDAIDTKISERIPNSNNIYPDDIQAFIKIMQETEAGVPYSETEFRIRDIIGQYYWCRIRATTQFNSEGQPIKAVGVIVDIDNEKKRVQELVDQAQKDPLTGLYNKETVKIMVESLLALDNIETIRALLILDIDNFKSVNDTYGHLVGDNLLSDVAVAIKDNICENDVAGRIGGDEFLIFLSEMKGEREVEKKAEKLLDNLHMITPVEGVAPISCSIGVALSKPGEADYRTLYKYADLALYARKKAGRGGVTFYTPEFMKKPDEILKTAIGENIVSEEMQTTGMRLSQYAFRILYSATDIEASVIRLLEIIGRSYDVSRAYIFESSDDGLTCSNTFEWCASGVEPQIKNLQNISYIDELGDYIKNFDKSGIFYCSEIENTHPDVFTVLEPQGIRSMLQCAMLDEGELVGYVGFDECRQNRSWTKKQMAAFKLTAGVFSTFIVKHRQKQRLICNEL